LDRHARLPRRAVETLRVRPPALYIKAAQAAGARPAAAAPGGSGASGPRRDRAALALDELPAPWRRCAREGWKAVAVVPAPQEDEHERTLRAHLERHFPHVCVSSDINAEFREYERSARPSSTPP